MRAIMIMVDRGRTLIDIAADFGVNRTTVSKYVNATKRYGIDEMYRRADEKAERRRNVKIGKNSKLNREGSDTRKKRYLSNDDKAECVKLYRQGKKICTISEDLWVIPSSVKKFIDAKQPRWWNTDEDVKEMEDAKLIRQHLNIRQQRGRSKDKCCITSCPEFKRCKIKENPQDCLVWKMIVENKMEVCDDGNKQHARRFK